MAPSPKAGNRVVSSQESASTGSPLTAITWKSLTWMWTGCVSGLVLTGRHSSVAPSRTVWSTRS